MSTWSEPVDVSALGIRAFSYPTAGVILRSDIERSGNPEGQSAVEAAFDQGKRLGEANAIQTLQAEIARERSALSLGIREFERERERYAKRVEPEVVKLALAIAKKILQREVQVDPILLAGVVRSALQRLDSSTKVRLRVSPIHSKKWTDCFRKECDAGLEITADPNFTDDQCRLESEIGTTELSLAGALEEIDEKFMELLTQREAVAEVLQ
jgi:flagellar biosynthesis/type III secretory pathway protein FliH